MKKFISFAMAMMLFWGNACYAYTTEFEKADNVTPDIIELGDSYAGYVTSVNSEYFYVNTSIANYWFQKAYSLDAFYFFRDLFGMYAQYEKTNTGYIACNPKYNLHQQSSSYWNDTSNTFAYLYSDDLTLEKEYDFGKYVYNVDYSNGEYIVTLGEYGEKVYYDANGVETRTDGEIYTYLKSDDFENWMETEKPSDMISEYQILYENSSVGKSNSRVIGDYTIFLSIDGNMYFTNDSVYMLPIQWLDNADFNVSSSDVVYWEDERYLYLQSDISADKVTVKTLKQPLYDELESFADAPYVVYNNTILAFETPPVIENGTTLIPIRFLFEQMGAEVDWDSDTQTASISDDDTVISFSIDDTTAKVNGKSAEMTVPAQLINDKTMVPVRFLSEELGYTVTWDGDNRIITIE